MILLYTFNSITSQWIKIKNISVTNWKWKHGIRLPHSVILPFHILAFLIRVFAFKKPVCFSWMGENAMKEIIQHLNPRNLLLKLRSKEKSTCCCCCFLFYLILWLHYFHFVSWLCHIVTLYLGFVTLYLVSAGTASLVLIQQLLQFTCPDIWKSKLLSNVRAWNLKQIKQETVDFHFCLTITHYCFKCQHQKKISINACEAFVSHDSSVRFLHTSFIVSAFLFSESWY